MKFLVTRTSGSIEGSKILELDTLSELLAWSFATGQEVILDSPKDWSEYAKREHGADIAGTLEIYDTYRE